MADDLEVRAVRRSSARTLKSACILLDRSGLIPERVLLVFGGHAEILTDKLDTTTLTGKRFFTAMAMLRHCEADLLKENIRMALKRRRLDG